MNEHAVWSILHQEWKHSGQKYIMLLLKQITAEELWQLSRRDFSLRFPLIPNDLVEKYYQRKCRIDLSKVEEELASWGISLIKYSDLSYPEALKQLYDPPPLLYCRGNTKWKKFHLAVVGSRKADHYGKTVAKSLSKEMSEKGISVVSGLARGIDSAAHTGALEGDAGTIAVLGCGVDVVYPPENQKLTEEILAHEAGTLLSEQPLGSQPLAFHFPLRNRIISGLSAGVVVVQAKQKSGALITAETALEQGKDVFAVPGLIHNALSEGTHKLLKDGAKIVTQVNDILEEYGQACLFQEKIAQDNNIHLTPAEEKVYNLLGAEAISVEELAVATRLPMAELMPVLSILELYGLIQQIIGRKYIRVC